MTESTFLDLPTPVTKAIAFITGQSRDRPISADLVTALQQLEKLKPTAQSTYSDLAGNWQLGFITGTQKVRQSASRVLNAGRFVPKWVKIQITYRADPDHGDVVENSVQIGSLELKLTGPVQFYGDRQILAFDFTRMSLKLFQRPIYEGYIRGGQDRETLFPKQTLKEQAFFKYFLIHPDCIAARGRGGGLALWVKHP